MDGTGGSEGGNAGDGSRRPALVLVLGGARSGKSGYAERLAGAAGRPVTYVATARDRGDPEMAARIAAHRNGRPDGWRTLEAPLLEGEAVEAALAPDAAAGEAPVVLVDCLTLWLTNVMLAEPEPDDAAVASACAALVGRLEGRRAAVVAVSNEVGEGIVPATRLGRRFRDHQGRLNQDLARAATDVVRLVAGCPLVVKPAPAPDIRL